MGTTIYWVCSPNPLGKKGELRLRRKHEFWFNLAKARESRRRYNEDPDTPENEKAALCFMGTMDDAPFRKEEGPPGGV